MSKQVLNFINDEKFAELFVTGLGWSLPRGLVATTISSEIDDETYTLVPAAQYQGLSAWVCSALPKRAVRTELSRILANQASDFVIVFTDGRDQVWSWPSINETRLSFRRLTAQHHRVGDKNDALARRIERFEVGPEKSKSVANLLIAVKNGFDTDTEAALRIADLHSKLMSSGMDSTDIEIFLTRLLFLFFGEDTDLFARGPYDASVSFQGTVTGGDEFRNLILKYPDDNGLNQVVLDLFAALRTPIAERKGLSADVLDFPYVNGGLFQDVKPVPRFDKELTDLVLACSNLDWSDISPAIFGSMFEGLLESTIKHIVNSEEGHAATRRQLGAHYTSEENILRVIRPLFLDDLREELKQAGTTPSELNQLHNKISSLTFFDPACGCGNFLVVTYKELREIENEILSRLLESGDIRPEDISSRMNVKIDQFFGIEISKSASAIAQVALWITDHQQNVETFALFGAVRHSIPLTETPGIVRADALTYPWESVISPEDCDFIVGNPPYLGKSNQSAAQKAALKRVLTLTSGPWKISRPGNLDYISGWFVKAALYAGKSAEAAQQFDFFEPDEAWGVTQHLLEKVANRLRGTADPFGTRIAFVSTNSICQGEQVPALWPWLMSMNFEIQFAYRTFKWSNNNPGAANVFCVVIGLGRESRPKRLLVNFDTGVTLAGEAEVVNNINPYLVPGKTVIVHEETSSLVGGHKMVYGNKPTDGQNLILDEPQKNDLIQNHPESESFIRPLIGAEEFLYGKRRFCIWVADIEYPQVKTQPWATERFDAVRLMRQKSTKAATKASASTPYKFQEVRHTGRPYLLVPSVSSEDRKWVPIGYIPGEVISTNANFMVPDATLSDFAVLTSNMHNAWMRATSGRLEGRYRYSNTLTFNTFPWPEIDVNDQRRLEIAAQRVLDVRESEPDLTLATLYSRKSMPAALLEAHEFLDHAVDSTYGYSGPNDDLTRLAFLLALYENLVSSKSPLIRR